jgi:subtilisin family serine protease
MTLPRVRATLRNGIIAGFLVTLSIIGIASAENVIRREAPTGPSFLGYVPDELVVAFKPSTAHQLYALPPQAGRARANLERVQAVLDRVAARSFEREFADAKPQAPGSSRPEMTGYYILKLAPGMDLDVAKAELEKSPDVDHVEKDGIHAFFATPNDPYYLNASPPVGFPWKQWHYWQPYGIGADVAWDTETGDTSVAVGITDSGVRYYHADLGGTDLPQLNSPTNNGNIWVHFAEIPANGIDDDGNGFVDDVIGWDFVGAAFTGYSCADSDCTVPDNDPRDGEGHGTHVAGTVAAITNNGNRVAGIAGGFANGTNTGAASGVKLIPLRIGYHAHHQGQPVGVVNMTYAAQAMNYVAGLVDQGVDVTAINCSWGSSNSGGVDVALANLQAKDVLVVCAAGNSAVDANEANGNYLSTVPGVVTVAATDSLGLGASFTNVGANVDLAAPGVHVLSTYDVNVDDGNPAPPDGDYVALLDGTSMASPHVVGAAAVLESYNRALTAAQKAALLVGHTKAFAPGNTKIMGTGILDLAAALAAAPSPTTGVGPTLVTRGGLQLRAFPNPARGRSDLAIQARPGQRVDLRIIDASGRSVRAMSGTADGTGVLRLRWDGKDSAGRAAGSGLFFVTATTAEGHASSKLVVLD